MFSPVGIKHSRAMRAWTCFVAIIEYVMVLAECLSKIHVPTRTENVSYRGFNHVPYHGSGSIFLKSKISIASRISNRPQSYVENY